jgi:hypothetical protein
MRGVLILMARMIPVHLSVDGPESERKLNVEVLNLPWLTPQAVLVKLCDAMLDSNESTVETSYRLTGSIQFARPADLMTLLAEARRLHSADNIYVSLLVPEIQAGMDGQTLASLPLSVANALEPLRTAQDVNLNGESAEVAAQAPAGGVLNGFQVLNLRMEPGGGLN